MAAMAVVALSNLFAVAHTHDAASSQSAHVDILNNLS
jgi:hypothetical protein